ncbi:serine/threonine-protein kinase [Nonomuraea soli]|uniref:non-specific serine/threonine protein kinase n=1 Tax=Nonomuraea soli TaxID=1032476 RepID=A0A7W0HVH8_9ACTN|nr:serine/threonine-protein kinase [Nonomuraea soli]MBA2896816.1 serine/threonine protein kinase [Nonomuraea soli]
MGGRLVAGRYQLGDELGRGGMGVVWEGHDTLLNRSIAVKEVLLPAGSSDLDRERQLLRTAREARNAAKLNHSAVVAIFDVVEEDGRPWIIMERVQGRSIEEVVATTGALPVRQAADVGRQVLAALRAAHALGILHRDVKPSNILLTSEGRAVLTDFGIATAEGDASLTSTGMVTGSPAFLAPERVRAAEAGPASDLWSLGATLYASLLGRSPFERGEPMATITALLSEEPDYRRIPPAMHPVLQGLLVKDPQTRLTGAEADRLLAAIGTSAPPRPSSRGLGRTTLVIAGALMTAVVATLAFVLLQPAPGTGTAVAQRASVSPLPVLADTPAPTPSATPTPTPTPTRTRSPLRAWTSPEGWSVERPVGWDGTRKMAYTEWLKQDRTGHFSVQEQYSTLNVNQVLQDAETVMPDGILRSRRLPGGGVEWESRWKAPLETAAWARSGETYRQLSRAVVSGDTLYVLSWTAPEDVWSKHLSLGRQVLSSFTPPGG